MTHAPPIIRRAFLSEYRQIARLCGDSNHDAPLTLLLAPNRAKFYSHYARGFRWRALRRMLDSANITLVACEPNSLKVAVAYIQMVRYGHDAGTYTLRPIRFINYSTQLLTREYPAARPRFILWRWILIRLVSGRRFFILWLAPDKSEDLEI